MVLTSANSGKYLLKRWHEQRAEAMEDRTQFSQEELDWLEIGANDGLGEFNDDNFKTINQPIDPNAPFGPPKTRMIDIRQRPGQDGVDNND